MQLHLFLPFFLIGAGGVLLVNGLAIYEYFTEESNTFLVCRDALRNNTIPLDMGSRFDTKEDIHGDSRHIVIEFTGALASVTFYVSCYSYKSTKILTPYRRIC